MLVFLYDIHQIKSADGTELQKRCMDLQILLTDKSCHDIDGIDLFNELKIFLVKL